MIIHFATEQQLIDFLADEVKIVKSFSGDIEFSSKKYTKSDFLEYLKNLNIITYNYDCIIDYNYWSNIKNKEFRLKSVQLNYQNFELLYSNDLINNDVYQHRLLTVNEICEILGVTRPTVYKLFNDEELEYYEILSQKKVKFTDLMSYISSKKKR